MAYFFVFPHARAGLKPRFVHGEPPSDTDIATVVQKISRRIIRKLRQLGYLEAGLDATVASRWTGWGDAGGLRLRGCMPDGTVAK